MARVKRKSWKIRKTLIMFGMALTRALTEIY